MYSPPPGRKFNKHRSAAPAGLVQPPNTLVNLIRSRNTRFVNDFKHSERSRFTWIIQGFTPHREVNILHLGYKNQSVNAV